MTNTQYENEITTILSKHPKVEKVTYYYLDNKVNVNITIEWTEQPLLTGTTIEECYKQLLSKIA